jgi:hypothetical protein
MKQVVAAAEAAWGGCMEEYIYRAGKAKTKGRALMANLKNN